MDVQQRLYLVILVVLSLCLAACSGGGGGGGGTAPANPDDPNAPPNWEAARYSFNLRTGVVTALVSAPQLSLDAVYTNEELLLQRITVPGASPVYMAITELTRAHWQHISADQPWLFPEEPALLSPGTAAWPATGMSGEQLDAWCQSAMALPAVDGQFVLRRPKLQEWQWACTQGSGQAFSWGNARAAAAVAAHAWLRVSNDGAADPQAVGQLATTVMGFYDLHGNAAEWLADNQIIGGSWYDNPPQATALNPVLYDPSMPHIALGARIVLEPVR